MPSVVLAIPAVAIQFVAMAQYPEAVATGDLVLGGLDHLALELDDLSTAQADQVIVVGVRDLVAGGSVETLLLCETGITQQPHGPIHRRVPNLGVLGANMVVESLAGDVSLHREEDVENGVSLAGVLEVVFLEVAGQGPLLYLVRHGRTIIDTGPRINRSCPGKE